MDGMISGWARRLRSLWAPILQDTYERCVINATQYEGEAKDSDSHGRPETAIIQWREAAMWWKDAAERTQNIDQKISARRFAQSCFRRGATSCDRSADREMLLEDLDREAA